MASHPEILWAQRSSEHDPARNLIYLTMNLPDIQPGSLNYELKPSSFSFSATAGDASKNIAERKYAFDLDFFKDIDPDHSKSKLSSRAFNLVLRKKDAMSEYWPRLTKEKVRTPYIKTDFDKWVDEDEQDGAAKELGDDLDMGDGMGGMGGMGGMDFDSMMKQMGAGAPSGPVDEPETDDSDDSDEGPPPLE